MIRFIFVFITFLYCFGNDISYLESKPKGIERDFFIYQHLINNEVNEDDMVRIYNLIDVKTPKIIKLLNIPLDKMPLDLYCTSLSYEKLLLSSDECFNIGFKLKYAIDYKIDKNTKTRIKSKEVLDNIAILESKDALNRLLNESGEKFSNIYTKLPRSSIFNKNIKNTKLLDGKNYYKSIYNMLISNKYPKFMKSLLKANVENVNDFTFFALGLNELMHGKKHKAINYFKKTADVTRNPLLKDKAIFWQYKLTDDEQTLQKLANSINFNLYSLFASKKLNISPKYNIITDRDSMFSNLGSDIPFDIQDPFKWQILRNDIRKIKDKDKLLNIAKLFYTKSTLPHLAYILNLYYGYSKEFFLMPYLDRVKIEDDDIKILLYAIAKKESHFIPTAISRSFALGLMQIIPSNVFGFAKEQGIDNITLDSMFDPSMSIKFGEYYIKYLKKHFVHPLFIAYSYNGGPTFLRNYLNKHKDAFSKKNKYDPWLSMELITYEESRWYGLSVVANYIVYSDLYGDNIDIDYFLSQTLR